MTSAASDIDAGIPRAPKASIQLRRMQLLAVLVAVSAGYWFLTSRIAAGAETSWWFHFVVPSITLLATLRCYRTIGSLADSERKAWHYFTAGWLGFAIADFSWGALTVFEGPPASTSYLIAFCYSATPVGVVASFWHYQRRDSRAGVTLVQVGNLGIIFSTILLAYLILFYKILHLEVEATTASFTMLYGVLDLAALAFGMSVILFNKWGRNRRVVALMWLAFAALATTNFSYVIALTGAGYQDSDFINVLYVVSSCLLYWAAFEQDQLRLPGSGDAPDQNIENRVPQWESLLPALAVASLMAITFVFRDGLTIELLPYFAGASVLFVVSLAIRNWWGQEIEAESLAQVQQANRELWDEMQTRTLVQEELRQSQKMEALGQLTGGVAHDFNNLLAIITGAAELAELKVTTPTQVAGYLGDIKGAAARGAGLTQRLLALSRHQALNPEHLELESLIDEMRSLLKVTLGESIALEIEDPIEAVSCVADRAQLENAILNLAINARDAMIEGGTLTIRYQNLPLDGALAPQHLEARASQYTMIAISDTGTGIPAEMLERVFEPFYTTKQPGQGTGLGLSMVYGFAKQSGGHVAIESEEQVGTEVRLYLPTSEERVPRGVSERPEEMPRGRGESLVVVEDESDVRKIVCTLLRRLGYQVTAAADGVEALALLDRLPAVDLLLSDVVLPHGVSGVELAKRSAARFPGTKVLLMSGYATRSIRQDGGLGKNVVLLHKPFRQSDLARKVRSLLDEGEVLPRSQEGNIRQR